MASIYESLDIQSICAEFPTGWYQSLARAKKYDISLSDYESYVSTLLESTSNVILSNVVSQTNVKIPIIFHAVVDDIQILNVNEVNPTITFNPLAIIADLNRYFSAANIEFIPAIKNPSGDLLNIPGLDIIDGKSLTELRDIKSSVSNTFVHKYESDFVTPNLKSRSSNPDISGTYDLEGVTLDKLYEEHQWNPNKFLNVFLVTYLNSTTSNINGPKGKLIYTSENAYIADMAPLGLNNFNITLPFFALGQGSDYGYKYADDHPAIDRLRILQENTTASQVAPFSYNPYNKVRFLAKALGEMFGLSPVTSFTQTNVYSVQACTASKCIWSDYLTNSSCGDCARDTLDVDHPFADVSNNICFDSETDSLITSNTTLNVMNEICDLDVQDNLLFYEYSFTYDQIIRMHANMSLMYFNSDTGTVQNGVLKNLVENAVSQTSNLDNQSTNENNDSEEFLDEEIFNSDDPLDLSDPCGRINIQSSPRDIFNTEAAFTDPSTKKLSLGILKIAEYNSYLKDFENKEASTFKTIKDKIHNIINFSK
tara:strand:- start:570 stop:2186 length:1617 start_codon:yes stop_codon:yes gene_type:complete